jgi:hypothetical protein
MESEIPWHVKEWLEQFPAKDRPVIAKGVMSKNNSSQRRAAKKIDKARKRK